MSTQHTLSALPFLNRIALDTMKDPLSADQNDILHQIFQFADPIEYIELFDQFCICAMNENYSWPEGGPGNLLFTCEKFELFVEACFILQLNRNNSQSEFKVDQYIIDSFFSQYSLQQWKKEFHDWVESAFADFSVIDNCEPNTILKFPDQMKRLLQAFI